MSSSETAAGVSTPRSVNSSEMYPARPAQRISTLGPHAKCKMHIVLKTWAQAMSALAVLQRETGKPQGDVPFQVGAALQHTQPTCNILGTAGRSM